MSVQGEGGGERGACLLPAELVGVDNGDIVIGADAQVLLSFFHLALEAVNAANVEEILVYTCSSRLRCCCCIQLIRPAPDIE